MNIHRPRASGFVFPAPFIDLPPGVRRNRRHRRWPGIFLAFIIGLAVGWFLRGGGAILP